MLNNQKGISLIELLIALVIAIIVSATALNIYITSMHRQTDNIKLTRLNQDMRAIMDLMVTDIRRSGFVTSSPDTNFDCLKSNPFNKINTFSAGTALAGTSCIVLAYNIDNNIAGGVCAVDPTDHFGFRTNAGALQMKTSGGTESSCANGTWEAISGTDTRFTATFFLNESELDITEMMADTDSICSTGEPCNGCVIGNQCLTIREVMISLKGELDAETEQTITAKVRVRNDEFDQIH